MAATKSELRRIIRARRAARAPDAQEAPALLAAARAAGLLGPGGSPDGSLAVAAYIASPGEPDPQGIRASVRAAGGVVLLPVPCPGRELAWALDDGRYALDRTLPVSVPTGPEVGRGAGCLTERGVSLLLVPALAVDRSGTRLGQGGGFYDRLLADLGAAPAALRVAAVVHPEEVLAAGELPRDAHDVPVPTALTYAGLVALG